MDQNFTLGGKSLVPAEYLSLLSVQGQFGVIWWISSFGWPCIYFWLKYSGIFVLPSLYITGSLLTSKWPSRASRPLGLLLYNIYQVVLYPWTGSKCFTCYPAHLCTGTLSTSYREYNMHARYKAPWVPGHSSMYNIFLCVLPGSRLWLSELGCISIKYHYYKAKVLPFLRVHKN